MYRRMICVAAAVSLSLTGCGGKEQAKDTESETSQMSESAADTAQEPDYVTVQHILIGFEGTVPGKTVMRTQEEAKALAEDILARANAGEDFDAMVQEYTDDAHPGIYKMSNLGVAGDPAQGIFPRDRMVPAFGDVGFPLAVGEVGLAVYDQEKSPYGYHVIKRVE